MSRNMTALVSWFAVFVVVMTGSAQVGAQEFRGEWRGAWEAVPDVGASLGDQFFHVQYDATPRGETQSELSGYVYNDYGQPADAVQLEITELDANGQPVASEVRPVQGVVPAEGRAYFDVQVPRSAFYRVKVQTFDFIEDGSSGAS